MRYLYTFLFYLILPFIFLRLLWRSRHLPDYRKRFTERLGFSSCAFKECIWIHTVSVGETIAAIPLIKQLKTLFPTIPLLVTNMTPTGAQRVKESLKDAVIQLYIPYDLPSAIKRFLHRTHPIIGIMMETELWPNLFTECKKRHIPLVIANARLSEKSAKSYKWVSHVTREMLAAIHHICAQNQKDADHFIALGMPKNKITVTGNLKFDLELPTDLQEKSLLLRKEFGNNRPIWIAASTHATEEDIILSAHAQIRQQYHHALLILVPRHPNRFDEIAQLIDKRGFHLVRRSRHEICLPETDIYLGDTMGELLLLYASSDIAFVGGSLAPIGGHNILEPASLLKPIITGPYLFNFLEISRMMQAAKGMVIVHNASELAQTIIHFFEDKNDCQLIVNNAERVMQENRGSLKKQLKVIQDILQSAANLEKHAVYHGNNGANKLDDK